MKTTYTLTDTFNDVTISHHRTVLAAVRAKFRHLAAVKRHNGPDSYLTYSITSSDGRNLAEDIMAATEQLECRY